MKSLALTLMVLSSTSLMASTLCGKVLLITPKVGSDLALSDRVLIASKKEFTNVKDIIESEKGYQVQNNFFLGRNGSAQYTYDLTVVVTYTENSADVLSGREYSAVIYNGSWEVIEKGKSINRNWSSAPNSIKWLKQVAKSLKSCK